MARQAQRKQKSTAPQAARPRQTSALWPIFLIIAAALVVYANSLSNPFVFDDHDTIENNTHIRSTSTMFQSEKGSALTGRPVVAASFALNYAVSGNGAGGYRAVNLAIHILCGLVLFGVARRTLRLMGRAESGWLAGAIGLVWVVHPLGTEEIDYLTQRTESLMVLFYALTLYCSVRALGSARWIVPAIVACVAGLLCKESMLTAPIVVVLYDRAFAFASFGAAIRARWRLYAGLASTWIVLAVILATQTREFSGGYSGAPVSSWTYLLNQSRMITHYLRLTVWPDALVPFYGWAMPVTLSDVWPYALGVIALLAVTAWLLVTRPRVGFLAAAVFITLAPTSSVIPIAAEVGADRRMYLPLIFLVALGVVAFAQLIRRTRDPGSKAPGRLVPIAALVLVVGALGARTIARNNDYQSELTLSRAALAAWPSAVGHHMVGLSLVNLGRHDEALPELRAAIDGYPPARYDLGAGLFRAGRLDEAAGYLRAFAGDEPHLFAASAAHTLLGRIATAKGDTTEAAKEFMLAISGRAPDPAAFGPLADLKLDQGAYSEAIAFYEQYLKAYPTHTAALAGLGIALASSGRTAEAIAAFGRAVELDPGNARARENLVIAHDVLGQAYAAQRRYADARSAFERALQLDPSFEPARRHLAGLPK